MIRSHSRLRAQAFAFLSALSLVSLIAPAGTAFAQQPKPKPAEAKPVKPKPKPADAEPAATPPPPASPPPPWSGTTTPLSTAGTQLMPVTPAAAPTVAAAGGTVTVPSSEAEMTQDNRFKMLEARLAADEKIDRENAERLAWLRGFKMSGYVQPQLIWQGYNGNASPNGGVAGLGPNDVIARSDGTTSNTNFFRLRRARLKVEYMPTEYARFVMEIDPTPTGGPSGGIGTIARNVEADGIAHWTADIETEFGVGIFKIPFGFEVLQTDADRPFIERSWGEQNMTPGEFDTGAKAYSTLFDRKLTVQLAVINGVTQGEKTFALLPDQNKAKDLVGRINYNFGPLDIGVSGYYGHGQNIDTAALKFKQFQRYAGNIEAALHHTFIPALGATKLFGEITLAQNMDRGVKYAFAVPAIPSMIGTDAQNLDERNLWVRLEQDITQWATIGARYDFYSPDTAQKNDARDTYSFVAVAHFTKGLQLMTEFDHAIDNVHKPNAPPAAKQIETFSGVLQARF